MSAFDPFRTVSGSANSSNRPSPRSWRRSLLIERAHGHQCSSLGRRQPDRHDLRAPSGEPRATQAVARWVRQAQEKGVKQDIQIPEGPARDSATRLALVGTPVVLAAYALALGIARDLPPRDALAGSVANTIPAVLFGILAYRLVRAWLVGRTVAAQIAGHAVLAAVYALLSYWLLMVMLGVVNGISIVQFTVEPFPVRASAWQLLQNVTIYGLIAALAYIGPRSEPVTVVLSGEGGDAEPRRLTRYFIRSGDEIQPIDVASIVSIAGADDYAQVRTVDGTHLVRMTLAEFEKTLDPTRFIRVHRSRIVNVEQIARAEPAGSGRLLLYMHDGEAIPASRAGSRLLRDRVL
jgi:two-component system, LytTR family, response regulator